MTAEPRRQAFDAYDSIRAGMIIGPSRAAVMTQESGPRGFVE